MTTVKQPYGRQVAASALEELGKQASRLATTSGLSLTEAAVRTLGREKLNSEQVRRVVEFCNIDAVNQKYASLRGQDRIVDIAGGPADPAEVIQQLKAASAPQDVRVEALEYSVPPSQGEKRSSAVFQKVAAHSLPDLRDKLAAAHEQLVEQVDVARFAMEQAYAEARGAVKSAALQGLTMSELQLAWTRRAPGLAKVASAGLELDWGDPASSRRISDDHPVMQYFGAFVKSAERYSQATSARKEVETQLARVDTHLRGVA